MMVFILFALYSCNKQKSETEKLTIDKLYIFAYTYSLAEEYPKFYVGGFSELDKDFNVKYARRPFYNSDYFYNSEDIVPDNLRNKISSILLKYQTDTTFLYQGDSNNRIYDGPAYRFIIQKNNQKDITIKFDPKFLPEDLQFIYAYLYGNREKSEHQSKYDDLFKMFKEQVKDDRVPIPMKGTIEAKPPIINE